MENTGMDTLRRELDRERRRADAAERSLRFSAPIAWPEDVERVAEATGRDIRAEEAERVAELVSQEWTMDSDERAGVEREIGRRLADASPRNGGGHDQ